MRYHNKKKVLRQLFVFLLLLLISSQVTGNEIRAMWVVRSTLQSKTSIHEMIRIAELAGIDNLFVQVNMSGFAYYKSNRLPQAVSSFDPLDYVLKEAHSRGIKVHAWLNAFTVGSLGSKPQNSQHVLYKHPDWALVDNDGNSVLSYSKGKASEALPTLYLEPGLKEVQNWVVENFLEVVTHYPVDGIHFDFIRYPGRDFGYHPEATKGFVAKFGFKPQELVTDFRKTREKLGRDRYQEAQLYFDDFRRAQITSIVQRVYEGTKKIRPNCLVSAAVFPEPSDAKDQKFQDWFTWLAEGFLDYACPMIYDTEDYILAMRLNSIEKLIAKNRVIVGLGPYKDSVEGTLRKIDYVKNRGFAGFILFSYDSIKGSTLWTKMN